MSSGLAKFRVFAAAVGLSLFPSAGMGKAQDAAGKFRIDKDKRIYAGIRDDARIQSEAENTDEYLSYGEVLQFANQFPAADLEAHARRDVSFKDLMGPYRADYKLDLILLEGRLHRLKQVPATPALEAAGVRAIYEGWLYPRGETDPVCLWLTEAPADLTPSQHYDSPPTVRFAGYVFKVMRYESEEADPADPKRGKVRRAPLLIGKSVTVIGGAFTPGAEWQGSFVPAFLTGLGVLSVIGFGLAWWYRRGDRAVRAAVADRTRSNPFAGDDVSGRVS